MVTSNALQRAHSWPSCPREGTLPPQFRYGLSQFRFGIYRQLWAMRVGDGAHMTCVWPDRYNRMSFVPDLHSSCSALK
jgi:hypothetical protein